MLNHILVPLDGSQLSELALEYASQIVAKDGIISLVSVMDLPTNQAYFVSDFPISDYSNSPETNEKIRRYTTDYLKKRVETLQESGYRADFRVEIGYPETVIIDIATREKVDAIVMSTHGRSGVNRLLFGSVTQRVLNATPCPVFVVPNQKLKHVTTPEKEAVEFSH